MATKCLDASKDFQGLGTTRDQDHEKAVVRDLLGSLIAFPLHQLCTLTSGIKYFFCLSCRFFLLFPPVYHLVTIQKAKLGFPGAMGTKQCAHLCLL